VPVPGSRPFDPWTTSVVGGVDCGPSTTYLRVCFGLSVVFDAGGRLSGAVSELRRACEECRCIFGRKFRILAGRGPRPGPPPAPGRGPRSGISIPAVRRVVRFAIPVFGRHREPVRRRSPSRFWLIFALCGGPEAVSTLRRRPGAESMAPFDRATPTSYWSPFDSERLRHSVSEVSRSKRGVLTGLERSSAFVRRGLMDLCTRRGEPSIVGLRESDPFPRSSLARGAGIVAADLEI
jgi:hypothetical protein